MWIPLLTRLLRCLLPLRWVKLIWRAKDETTMSLIAEYRGAWQLRLDPLGAEHGRGALEDAMRAVVTTFLLRGQSRF